MKMNNGTKLITKSIGGFREMKNNLRKYLRVILLVIMESCLAYALDYFGYIDWTIKSFHDITAFIFECIFNPKSITLLSLREVALTYIAVLVPGIIIMIAIFKWIPNACKYIMIKINA